MSEREIFTLAKNLEWEPPTPQLSFEISGKIITPLTKSIIYFATSEIGQQVIIKVPAISGKGEREWLGLTKAHAACIPVPEPIALAKTQTGQTALIIERLYGNNLYNHPDKNTTFQLGQIVRKMHEEVKIDGKERLENGSVDYFYYEMLLHSWLQNPTEHKDTKEKFQSLIKSLSDSMITHCKSARPVFNHNDIHNGQVIVNKQGITLIDFAEWVEESSLNDLAYYLFHTIRTRQDDNQFRYFLQGYLEKQALSEIEKDTIMFYLLFISCRALNYFYKHRSKYLEIAEGVHLRVVNYVGEEKIWKGV